MGKTVALDGPALAWARTRFGRYYDRTVVPPPSRFPRREFAAFPFAAETLMRRHASLTSADELQRFLRREVPRHVYYSSAYYQAPDHPMMAQKGWLGADLIFDLDADHLRGADGLTYAEQLALVKTRLASLVDDFLVGDFGLAPSAVRLVFSGGRGYHVHVSEERFLGLNSPERRELVEYVMGVGFDPGTAVLEDRARTLNAVTIPGLETGVLSGGARGSTATRPFKRLVPSDTPGWAGRTSRAVQSLLGRWETLGAEGTAEEIAAHGVPPRRARALAKALITEGKAATIRSTLSLEVFKGEIPPELLALVLAQASIEVQGETDAPVTTDIHRLIRLPGSLHGGTGLRVMPLDRGDLEKFDPLRDALVPAGSSEVDDVVLTEAVHHEIAGATVAGGPGDRRTLPTPVATFLVLRGEATLPPPPGP